MSEQNRVSRKLRVFILGTGNPIPTFILRRLKKLDELGQPLVIASSPEWISLFNGFKNAEIVKYKTLNGGGLLLFIRLFFQWLNPFTDYLWRFAKGNSFLNKLKWVVENHQLTHAKNVGAIHM